MGGIIIPKRYIVNLDAPLIFLGGPIRGTENWQDGTAIKIITKNPEFYIASPRRGIREKIEKHVLSGREGYFLRQRSWERYYLDKASKEGVIMFWLPKETEHKCEKSYGAMTRIELGQWMTKYKNDKTIRWCLGTDGEFSEIETINYDLTQDAPDKKVFGTLEETIEEALRIAKS